jgi:phosphoglycerate dehydrogenase-like enzyme
MDQQAVALKGSVRVLAHFVPGDKVLDFLAPEANWLDIRWCADDDDTSFYRELPDAEVIWHVLRPLSGADLRRGGRLRLVHKLGAGVNTIDVETATKCGIAVANMPGSNAPSVAEGTVLLMLAALRRLPELDHAVRNGHGWPTNPELGETVRDIGGCTVGLVGYGNVAKRVSDIVSAMGATVLHTSTRDDGRPGWRQRPELSPASGWGVPPACGGVPPGASDIVSLHLPLTADTHHLLNREAMAQLRPNACWSTRHVVPSSTKRRSSTRCVADGWPPRDWMFSKSSR